MQRTRLIWKLAPAMIALALVVAIAAGWIGARAIDRSLTTEGLRRLDDVAAALDERFGKEFSLATRLGEHSVVRRIADARQIGFTLFAPSGVSLVDTAYLGKPTNEKVVAEALAGRRTEFVLYDDATESRVLVVGIPLVREGRVAAILEVSQPTTHIQAATSAWWRSVALLALVGVIAAFAAAHFLAEPIARSFLMLRKLSDELSEGRGTSAHTLPNIEEAAELSESMSRLAERFAERLDGVLRINNEQEAVLAGMAEGVLAIDAEHRVISLNRAAGRLLGVNPTEIMGRGLHEIVRNPELLRLVDQILATRKPAENDIVFRQTDERILQVRGTMLPDSHDRGSGAVFVLNDVTRLRRLENMRRDFAANVSHELKTPITSIKGFVETILDGASAEDAHRFMEIIARQADRLDAIIDDLLALSRIEKEAEASDIVLAPSRLNEILLGAANDCQVRADERKIRVEIRCPDEVHARVNALLLQQAVRNLLENAVKYSDAGGVIQVVGERTSEEVRVSVVDYGCGIAPEHHARLFERFYRVDKARSRKLGGTGLGLAIVKHIVLAHRGRVTVESAPGKGSRFTIHLPPIPTTLGGEARRSA
ncbi:MAG: PAS domain-containing protein [Planctomycetia bacterium]|nr:PAS domain-containing protein [Planctomycetia bacterium]